MPCPLAFPLIPCYNKPMERIKVSAAEALPGMRLLVRFNNGISKIFDVRRIIPEYPAYAVLEDEALFSSVRVEPGGYGVSWNAELDASEGELWENGIPIEPASQTDEME